MRVLVTGGCGFIGSHLIGQLQEKGHDVFSYDIAESLDVTNPRQLRDSFKRLQPDQVYHLAGSVSMKPAEDNPLGDFRINLTGMINLLRLVDEYDASLVYTSTGAVYGATPDIPFKENSPCIPVSNYGVSKLASEYYLRKWVLTRHVDAKIARFFSVYGYGRKEGPINIFIEKALKGEPLTIYGDGANTRDFTYISDVIRGVQLVMKRGERGEIYNIASGREASVNDVAEIIQEIFPRVRVRYQPTKYPVFDLARSCADLVRAKHIGYTPRVTLKDGIVRTVEEYRQAL